MKNVARVLTALILAWLPAIALGANETSLLTQDDLSGGAVADVGAPPVRRSVNQAMYTALVTQEQINRVQLYLKSGPAQNGDLRVVQSSKPDQSQK